MLLLRSNSLPDDDGWIREMKLDGYRAVAFKSGGNLQLRSRNDNDMAVRYPVIARALAKLPDNTVIDGELAALDAEGRPSFNLLRNSALPPCIQRQAHPPGIVSERSVL